MMSILSLSLWVLAGSALAMASAILLVVSTFVRKGKRVSLVNLRVKWDAEINLRVLMAPSLRESGLCPWKIEGLE